MEMQVTQNSQNNLEKEEQEVGEITLSDVKTQQSYSNHDCSVSHKNRHIDQWNEFRVRNKL